MDWNDWNLPMLVSYACKYSDVMNCETSELLPTAVSPSINTLWLTKFKFFVSNYPISIIEWILDHLISMCFFFRVFVYVTVETWYSPVWSCSWIRCTAFSAWRQTACGRCSGRIDWICCCQMFRAVYVNYERKKKQI